MLRIILVEDSPTMVERLRWELERVAGAELVGVVDSEFSGVELVDVTEFDVAIIDLQLASGTGFGVLRRIRDVREQGRTVCAVVFTGHYAPALRVAAFEAGADYVLDKARELEALVDVVRSRANERKAAA